MKFNKVTPIQRTKNGIAKINIFSIKLAEDQYILSLIELNFQKTLFVCKITTEYEANILANEIYSKTYYIYFFFSFLFINIFFF